MICKRLYAYKRTVNVTIRRLTPDNLLNSVSLQFKKTKTVLHLKFNVGTGSFNYGQGVCFNIIFRETAYVGSPPTICMNILALSHCHTKCYLFKSNCIAVIKHFINTFEVVFKHTTFTFYRPYKGTIHPFITSLTNFLLKRY